jgi:hypothetical protein
VDLILISSVVEIIQVIQNLNNEVPLIRGKKTYARVYLDYKKTNQPSPQQILATITEINGQLLSSPIPLIKPVIFDTNVAADITYQRHNWNASLNFDLTEFLNNLQKVSSIKNLGIKIGNSTPLLTFPVTDDDKGISIEEPSNLAVTALILEYWDADSESYIRPEAVEVDSIRRFVEAAFPVVKLEWKTIFVRATDEFRSLNKTSNRQDKRQEVASRELRELLLQTMIHRNLDTLYRGKYKLESNEREVSWENTNNHLSLYLAVFADPSDRLGGAAVDSPKQPLHNVVAAAAVDLNGQLGAHELAHLLGRTHPGIPDRKRHGRYIGQSQIDPKFHHKTNEQGFLSFNADQKKYIGLHVENQFGEPKIYEDNRWFDLMTYRDPQWVSKHTYCQLLQRINDLADSSKFERLKHSCWVVFGEYDLDRKTGNILYVLPSSYFIKDAGNPESNPHISIDLTLVDKDGAPMNEEGNINIKSLVLYRDSNDPDDQEPQRTDMPAFGIFQAIIKIENNPEDIRKRAFINKVDLKILDNIVDTYNGLKPEYMSRYLDIVAKTENEWEVLNKNKNTNIVENGIEAQGPKNNRKKIAFVYNVIRDEYAIRYNWANQQTPTSSKALGGRKTDKIDNKLITVFQCRNVTTDRPNTKNDTSKECWETVLITTRQKGKVWVSPKFVYRESRKDTPRFINSALNDLMMDEDKRPLRDRLKDSIEIRVLFSSGFSYDILNSITLYANLVFPKKSMESLEERRARLKTREERSRERNPHGNYRPMYRG